MTMHNRRQFIAAALAATAATSYTKNSSAQAQTFPQSRTLLRATSRVIEVNGRAAKVLGLIGPAGTPGLTLVAGDRFAVDLRNEMPEPTTIHWHGLTPPWNSDGVADAPLPLLKSGEIRPYDFPVGDAGTHWMHAHTLQEQNLLAAPLIVREKNHARLDEQEVVILLHDFAFRPAEEILASLKPVAGRPTPGNAHHGAMDGMNHGGIMTSGPGSGTAGTMPLDVNDIDYDAYLANDRTLDDPEVVRVERGGKIRLRIINGATATGFWIDTGKLQGAAIAVDGRNMTPLKAAQFPLSMGQRIDIRLEIPAGGGAFPIFALREGAMERTGIVLATAGASVAKLASNGARKSGVIGFEFEKRIRSDVAAIRDFSDLFTVDLMGNMAMYMWGMHPNKPIVVRKGEWTAITMRNASMMAHPMHLHGHRFKVVALNGVDLAGAERDTLLIPPHGSATVAFLTDNPGLWAFHCHHLYHMAAGMMSTVEYEKVG